jgi:TIR domain
MGALLLLAVAFVVSYFLVKLCARWPRGRRWLVAGLLLLFIPGAIVVPELNTHMRATYSGALPWLAGVALVLATLWVVMRNRATLLAGADEARAAPMPSESESILATSEPPLQRVVTDPPVQPCATAAPQPSNFAPSVDRIFISYRRTDSDDVTGRIYDRLVQRFGKELIFKDVDSIPLGLDFREYVEEVVGRCNLLLAVVGDQWLASSSPAGGRRIDDQKDLVRVEIEAALQRKIPVVPVLVRGASVPAENQLPPSLAGLTYRNGLKIRSDPDFHRDMDRLIAGMEAHLHRRE